MEDSVCRLPFYDEIKKERYIEHGQSHPGYTWENIITYVNIGLDGPYYGEIHRIADQDSATVLVNKYRQLDSSYIPCDLEQIDPCYNPEGLYLRHDARSAFEVMCKAADGKGVHLAAISTFRSYDYQYKVYYKNLAPGTTLEDYQKERDKVSARAGHSEHQTGLAVDINDLEETFADTPEGQWLAGNSHYYGFILRYTKGKEWITGYSYEPWHFRYLGKELAGRVYISNLTYDEYYVRYLQ